MNATVSNEQSYGRALARAAAGAVIFGLPLLMTMEMWQLGFHMDRLKLALFVAVIGLVVFGLDRFAGFRDTSSVADDVLDTFAALLVGFVVAAGSLALFGLITAETGLRDAVGKIAVQAAPASFGAVLANKQLRAASAAEEKGDRAGYGGQLFLMGAGALFVAFNVAPTEEMILIGFKMSPWHAAALVIVSLVVLHALVFTVGFAGQKEHGQPVLAFFHFTLAGYGAALIVSLYILWTFGRIDGALSDTVRSVVVLGFPAALGVAVARLLV